jgi:hypothetical protein
VVQNVPEEALPLRVFHLEVEKDPDGVGEHRPATAILEGAKPRQPGLGLGMIVGEYVNQLAAGFLPQP